ncbi:IS5 family transposase [Sneathiella sp.]|uniref:IS5 family transposase n=1 Tax=Sneathiella sp. TaxID=1964365 RepID=UPI003568FCD7
MVWTPDTRKEYARRTSGYASSVTDAEWKKLEPLMPLTHKRGRPRKTGLRDVIDGIFYLLQSGCQWDMLPKDFPPWQTVYGYFREWMRTGLWEGIHDALYRAVRTLEGREESPTLANIDEQSAKTGPDARGDVGFDAGKNVKGRKRHIVVDILGMILKAEVHSAGIQDRDGTALALDRLTARFPVIKKVIADGAYAGPIAQSNSPRPVEIVKRSDAAKGFLVLPKRWIVERTFAWLGINRRLAKDFEKHAKTALTFIYTAMIKLMSRRLARYLDF